MSVIYFTRMFCSDIFLAYICCLCLLIFRILLLIAGSFAASSKDSEQFDIYTKLKFQFQIKCLSSTLYSGESKLVSLSRWEREIGKKEEHHKRISSFILNKEKRLRRTYDKIHSLDKHFSTHFHIGPCANNILKYEKKIIWILFLS